jgi:Ser/Thr protein kinase RdoA (MazF antagonist)
MNVLSVSERAVAESILSDAWNEPVEVVEAELVWERRHVVRLVTNDGRSAILKRPNGGDRSRDAFEVELASLRFLGGMPDSPAPALLGADVAAGILIMEELPPGRSLAHSLLGGDRDEAGADLVAYGTALGRLHGWSGDHIEEFERRDSRPWWLERIDSRRAPFIRVAAELGVATDGVDTEIDEIVRLLAGERHRAFVHGDLCPDNVRLADGRMRIFDFEASSAGSPALDAAYLLAPFPSCWCFADLPESISTAALNAYLTAGGTATPDELAAALGVWVVARGSVIEEALKQDEEWGTTTMRPRLLAWTRRFAATDAFPRLQVVAERLHDQFRSRWPDAIVPAYPAFAEPDQGSRSLVQVPDWWET